MILVSVYADEVSFVTSAPKAVEVNQQFRLSYKVNRGNVKEPRLPAIEHFNILSGPNRSTSQSYSNINGVDKWEHSVTFNYILLATEEGTFEIPGATITVDGEQITSNKVTIKVLPEDKTTSSRNSSGYSGRSGSGNNRRSANISDDELFIRATLNKTNVYEQEAVLLTYKVYSTVNLASLSGKMADLKAFQIQEVDLPQNKEWNIEHYNGRNYRTLTWQQYVLFPQQTGEIEIPSVTFEGVVHQQVGGSIMDPFSFFNGGPQVVEIKKAMLSQKLKLNVKPLPSGKPANFSGAVGKFNVSTSISATELAANEAVTVRLVVTGTGNMKLIKTPELQFPEDFEIYDPKVDNKFTLKSNGFSGSKVFEYLAIPRHGGKYTIPSLQFSYFDIESKQYKTIDTEEYTLDVEKGKEGTSQVVSGYVSKEELKLLGQDIRYIKTGNANLQIKGEYLFASAMYWICYIIPMLLFVMYIIIHRKKVAENANIAGKRKKKANKVAVRRLKIAKALLKENKKNEFYDEILKTLLGYISDKLNMPVSQLSKENIVMELSKKSVPEELIKEFEDVLNESEFARYAPGDAVTAMDNVYEMAINVISRMENSIKR